MKNKTYEALKDIVSELTKSNKTNDFSYFILNPNPTRGNLVLLQKFIDKMDTLDANNTIPCNTKEFKTGYVQAQIDNN